MRSTEHRARLAVACSSAACTWPRCGRSPSSSRCSTCSARTRPSSWPATTPAATSSSSRSIWTLGAPLIATAIVGDRARHQLRAGQVAQLAFVDRVRRRAAAAGGQGHQRRRQGRAADRAPARPRARRPPTRATPACARSSRSSASRPSSCWCCCSSARRPRHRLPRRGRQGHRRAPAKDPVARRADDLRRAADPVADEARQDVDAERYPNFARLAKPPPGTGTPPASPTAPTSPCPAILTGRRPHAELPTSRAYPGNLFTLLGKQLRAARPGADHQRLPRVAVRRAGNRAGQGKRLSSLASDLSIVERRLLLPQGMADKLPPIDRDWEDFRADAGDDGLADARTTSAAGGRPDRGIRIRWPATTCRPSASARRPRRPDDEAGRRQARAVDGPQRHPARAVALPARRQPVRRRGPDHARPQRPGLGQRTSTCSTRPSSATC